MEKMYYLCTENGYYAPKCTERLKNRTKYNIKNNGKFK